VATAAACIGTIRRGNRRTPHASQSGEEPHLTNTKRTIGLVATVAALAAGVAWAQEPEQNIDPDRHGNLAAAQRLVVEAFDRITEAQQDNRYNLGGHAARAKDLLRQANDELRLAADAANDHEDR